MHFYKMLFTAYEYHHLNLKHLLIIWDYESQVTAIPRFTWIFKGPVLFAPTTWHKIKFQHIVPLFITCHIIILWTFYQISKKIYFIQMPFWYFCLHKKMAPSFNTNHWTKPLAIYKMVFLRVYTAAMLQLLLVGNYNI